jgi:hypothetical protein
MNAMTLRFLAISILLISKSFNIVTAQTLCNRYGGDDIEYAYQLIEDPDGNYIMTGRSYSFSSTPVPMSGDIYTIKLNPSFNIVWTSVFQTPAEDEGNAIANAHGGGYLVAGASYDTIRGYDITLLKLDTGGTVQWSKLMGTPQNDQAEVIVPVSDGGYMLGGYSDSIFTGFAQAFVPLVVRINSNGSIMWARRFGFPTGVFAGSVYDIIEAQDGSLLVTGDIIRLFDGPDDSDIFLARFSSSGNLLWFKWMGVKCQGCQDMGAVLVEDAPQRFTLFGSSSITGSIYICSFDINGNILSESGLNTGTFAYANIHAVKAGNNRTVFTCPAYNSMLAVSIDTLHQVEWSSTYGNGPLSTPCSVLKKGSGYLVGGMSTWADPYREDYLIAVLDSTGYSCCMINEQPLISTFLHLSDSTGGAAFPVNLADYTAGIVKTGGVMRSVCTDVNGMQEVLSNQVALYPNPFDHYLCISFSDHQPHPVSVYDVMGKLMVHAYIKQSITIPTHKWPAGMYAVYAEGSMTKTVIRR